MRKHPASITIFTGPMMSGKTSHLIEKYHELAHQGIGVEYYKFTADTNYALEPSEIYSRNNHCVRGKLIQSFQQVSPQHNHVFFDEAQFCAIVNKNYQKYFFDVTHGRHIYIAGLDMDWQDMPFEATSFFMAIADQVNKYTANCHICGKPAQHSEKLTEREDRFDENAEYLPICRVCRVEKFATKFAS